MKSKVKIFQSIQFKFIIIYILLLLITIQVIGAYFARQMENQLLENFYEKVNGHIQLMAYNLEQSFSRNLKEEESFLQQEVHNILTDFDSNEISEIQVINNNRKVIATTNQFDQNIVGKRTTNSNVKFTLLLGAKDREILVNPRTGHRTLVMTYPLYSDQADEIAGVIYLEANLESVYEQLEDINRIFVNGTVLAISISALIGIIVARTITRPISEMRKQAHVMARGDFSKKVNVYSTDEIGQLAVSFNHLNDRLKQAQANTEGERRKLSSVLANMSDGVIATDQGGNIILMNTPAEKLVGKTFHEVQGKSLLEVLGLEKELSSIQTIKDTGSIIVDFSHDHRHLMLKANFSVIQDENEKMNGFITVLSDVTEEEKIERERKEFVANVSHELRTPLTTIRSYLEALTEGDTWRDENIAPGFLKVTQNETERMIRLVNDLLQLSKMDNKDYRLNKEKVDFIQFVHHVIDRFEMNKNEGVYFKRQLPDQKIDVWIDKDKITQVMDNIISNALKYSPEGGTITFSIVKNEKNVQFQVSDEGMGIPKNQVDKIFERFYRVDKARSRQMGGTGLGLAIAREMIEAHSGEIWAESEEGKGTTIQFTLPLTDETRGDAS
ncbi:MAG: cell wall metabolism sensor histidine kinase WalK [Bacillaceae bacterium]|nr:cell wall metabolism sensor histidine kinase WalK [Bacillaceae bacterium]